MASFASDAQADIKTLQASIANALIMGDHIVGTQSNTDVVKQTVDRNKELEAKKAALEADVKKKEAIINRTNRDFSDVKDSLPERLPKRTMQTVEDKTLAVVITAYVFMVLAFVWWYAAQAPVFLSGFVTGAAIAAVITLVVVMVGFYVL
jgi:hypothetical protein